MLNPEMILTNKQRWFREKEMFTQGCIEWGGNGGITNTSVQNNSIFMIYLVTPSGAPPPFRAIDYREEGTPKGPPPPTTPDE